MLTHARSLLASIASDQATTAAALAAVNAVSLALEAELVAQVAGTPELQALLAADMAEARRDAVKALLEAQAANLRDAGAAAEAMKAAADVAASAGNGPISEAAAAEAVRKLGLYTQEEQAALALQRAAGLPMTNAFAAAVGAFLKDNGDLRRLVLGSRFDQMTPEQRLAAVNRWLEQEAIAQGLGEGTNPRDPREISNANLVMHMSDQEKADWALREWFREANISPR